MSVMLIIAFMLEANQGGERLAKSMVKLFKVYLQRTSKKKHTLTFFASGWLFYEAQLLIKFVQVLESEGRSTDEIEINLIDPAYKSIEEREPTPRDISRRQSIEQFWTIAKRLTSSVKKKHVSTSVESYHKRIKSGVCAPTDIILAFDFGEVLTLKIACSLGLAYLKKLCTAEEFAIFCFPHPQSDAHIQLLRNEPAIDEQEVEIKELYAELSAIDLTDPESVWPVEKNDSYYDITVRNQVSIGVEHPFPNSKETALTVAGFLAFSFLVSR